MVPQLTGKVQQAYAGLVAEDTGDHDQLKAAIFQQHSITEETHRVFRVSGVCPGGVKR